MTLAVLLLLAISSTASPISAGVPQSATEPSAIQAVPDKPDQSATPQTQNPSAESKPSTATPAGTQGQPAKRPKHRKKAISSNCGSLPATSPAAGGGTNSEQTANPPAATTTDPSSAANAAQPTSEPSTAPKPCPPKKTIVSHGGASEPSIQLAGGPASDQAARQRDVVNQLLGVTERNLKEMAGKPLSSGQQDTVSQIRQFMDQSKSAATTGDLDRARTLAWKAELLSEDLMKPQK